LVRLFQILGAGALGLWSGTLEPDDGLSWTEWVALLTGVVSGALAVYGVVMMARRSRVRALQALASSALVSLFFGQFFAFAAVQLAALGGLVLDLGVLGALRFALSAENEHHEAQDDPDGKDPRRGIGQFL